MSVLIIGGNGFIGRNYITSVASQNSTLKYYATYRSSPSFAAFAHQYGVTPIHLDLNDPKSIQKLPQCESCLFVAGNANHALSPQEAQQEVMALLNFLDWFRGKLFFLSSGAVYYNLQGQISEEASISPHFPYGVTKFVLEQYIQHHYDIGNLKQFTILRLFYAFGRYERQTRLCRRVIESILKGESTFTVSAKGQSYIDPLSATDVAKAIDWVINTPTCAGEILNVCRGEPYYVKDFVALIAQSLGHPLKVTFDNVPESLPVTFWGNPKKLKTLTNFQPSPLPKAICAYADQIAHSSP